MERPDLSRYAMRLGVAEPEVVWYDDPRPVTPPGEDLYAVGPRAGRAVRNLMDTAYLQPVVEGLPSGSSFCPDETSQERRVREALNLCDVLQASKHPWAHIELDQARKMCLQRGGAPGWNVIPGGLVLPGAAAPKAGLRAVLALLLAREPFSMPRRYKRQTQHSYPDYLTTDTSLVLHALMAAAAPDAPTLARILEDVADVLGEGATPLSFQMYQRAGPTRKALPIIGRTANGAYDYGTLQGGAPRRRIVFGAPSAGNMWQLSAAGSIKSRITQVPWLWHFGPADVARKAKAVHGRSWVWYSDDISGYDQSVSDVHQREYVNTILRPIAGDVYADYKLVWKDLPLLGSPLNVDARAFLYDKQGMTPSGDLLTAVDGTLINAARVFEAAAAAMGVTVQRAADTLGVDWAFFCQGDDTLIGFGRPHDAARYEEKSLELGFTTKMVPGAVFLMHHIDPQTGEACALASRVFQQSVWNEYGGEAFELELAAFVARTSALTPRNPWGTMVISTVLRGTPFWDVGVRDARTAALHLARPQTQLALAELMRRKPRLKGRFHTYLPADVSNLIAGLLGDPDVPLPLFNAESARDDALRLAAWMAVKADERTSAPSLSFDLKDTLSTLREGVIEDDNEREEENLT